MASCGKDRLSEVTDDAAAEERRRSSVEHDDGESRRRPNPRDAALSSRRSKSNCGVASCGSGRVSQIMGWVATALPDGWKLAAPGVSGNATTLSVGDVVVLAASGDKTFVAGGTGVLARLLSVDPLLPPSSLILFRRRTTRGALSILCRRNPARWTWWNALSVAVIWLWTAFIEPGVRLRTSGVASGVVSKFLPLIHSLAIRSCMVSRSLGLTVSRPESHNRRSSKHSINSNLNIWHGYQSEARAVCLRLPR